MSATSRRGAAAPPTAAGTPVAVPRPPRPTTCDPWPAFDVPDDVRDTCTRLTTKWFAELRPVDQWDRCRLAAMHAIPPVAAVAAAADRVKSVRESLAANPSCPPQLRDYLASDEVRDQELATLKDQPGGEGSPLVPLILSGQPVMILTVQDPTHPELADHTVAALVPVCENSSDIGQRDELTAILCAHRACPSGFAAAQRAGELPRHIELASLARLASGHPDAADLLAVAATLAEDSALSLGELIDTARGVITEPR